MEAEKRRLGLAKGEKNIFLCKTEVNAAA